MSEEKREKTASWAVKFIVAIVCAVVAGVVELVSPGGQIAAGALLVAIVAAIWGAIEYLLTKKQK